VNKKIERNYLEIKSLKDLNTSSSFPEGCEVQIIKPANFQLNKFFYKNIGKKHHWVDRLIWKEKDWIQYVSDERVKTYVLKKNEDMAGYFELIIHKDKKEVEIAYLGLLEEYQNKKLGSHLLSSAIKNSFEYNPRRAWVHTCSLDHKNALSNYVARGMKIFKKETITI
jgi:ribosomal protein S18 acetylase RimI-like enzyme